jgi:hypothetical protein
MRSNATVTVVVLIGAAALLSACQPSTPAATTNDMAMTIGAPAPAQTPALAKTMPVKKVAAKSADAKVASAPVTESRVVAAAAEEKIITTVSGCLERDGDSFQLTDTAGDHAPKARSWKSGFVKKGSASIDVIDAGNRLNLASHVGHRVNINGTLVEREMRARSLGVAANSCE